MFRNKWIAVICLAFAFPLVAETAGNADESDAKNWVIAAEEFSATDVPAIYKNFSATLPSLIISRISGIDSRLIVMDEQKSRDMQQLSDDRIKLVKERAALVLERDQILLSPDTVLVKSRKKRETTDKIIDKETAIKKFDVAISKRLAAYDPHATTVTPIRVWTEKGLYTRDTAISLAKSLSTSKVSGLITGSIQDIAGYLYVTANLETGIASVPVISVSEASSYDEVDSLAATLAARLLPGIAQRKSVHIRLTVEPEFARVFIDGRLINNKEDSVTIFAGEHTISVSATGFKSAIKTAKFEGSDSFAVSIGLEQDPSVAVSFDAKGTAASLYFGTQYFGETPADITLPDSSMIGQATIPGKPPEKNIFSFLNPPINENGTIEDITTWFVFSPELLSSSRPANMRIVLNTIDTKTRIDKQRDILYWSLGGLYLSLPVSMISYGVCMNMYRAYTSGRLSNAPEYQSWSDIATYSRYVSIGFGINFAFQLVRYFIAAEQATPKTAVQEK